MIKQFLKKHLSQQIASRQTDPQHFYNTLQDLPNPDVILRKLGGNQDIYQDIMADAHVLGELRSMRAGILGCEWQLTPGGDRAQDLLAFDLCEKVFSRDPSPATRWHDVFWDIQQAILKGFSVLEIVWQVEDGYFVPAQILERPQRRFVFSQDNKLRLLTKDHPIEGIALDDRKWLLTKHMATQDNPYGIAVLSSCFWPYTFKHSGFKYFVKFCEKYGLPWAIGKYPAGTPKEQQDELADSLARMVEDSVAAIPDNGSVELIEAKGATGEPVSERLINICNREISKALTSQTLATEIQGQGSFAAAETHSDREQKCYLADRKIIVAKMNQLLRWITDINVANAHPPTFSFYDEPEARKDWVEAIDNVRKIMDVPADFSHKILQIPKPKLGEQIIPSGNFDQLQANNRTDFSQQRVVKHLEQWIEIFRAGDNTASDGVAYQFSLQDLDEIISNFDANDPAPYVIGHPKDHDPAYGWVNQLKRQGNGLWAKGTDIDPQFDQLIKEGRYRKRSVRINTTEQGWKLMHVGFLGAAAPSISGMKDNWGFQRIGAGHGHDFSLSV